MTQDESDDTEAGQPRTLRTVRLEAFSDGVFAIAITLLVLEIAVPPGSEHHLLRAVLDEWPSYLAYVVSFATVGMLWLGHTGLTEFLDRADTWLLRLNLLLLMIVSFIPFPTRLLADSVRDENAGKVATTIYGVTFFAGVVVLSVIWRYAVRQHLVRPDMRDEEVAALTDKLTPGLAGYAVMIALGIFLPVVAVIGYLLVALFYLIPFRLRRHEH